MRQDLVFNTIQGEMWTPKHIGFASTLHQATESKTLVDVFHKAGNTNMLQERPPG